MSKKDQSFLDLAMRLAEDSTCGNKHGAVVVRGSRVLALGTNKFRNCPRSVVDHSVGTENKSAIFSTHAEIAALSKTKNSKGATIYIARVNNQGNPMMSRPCDACMTAIMKAGIRKICYTW